MVTFPTTEVFVIRPLDSRALGDDHDQKDKEGENNGNIPMVEEDLSQKSASHFVGIAKEFRRMQGDVLADVVKIDDVGEIEGNGDAVDGDEQDVNDPLRNLVCDVSCWKTVVYDERKVERHGDDHIETHTIDIEFQSFAKTKVMEKLKVEEVEQPSAKAEGDDDGY